MRRSGHTWRPPTSWWTRCGDATRAGPESGSTCATFRSPSGPRRNRSRSTRPLGWVRSTGPLRPARPPQASAAGQLTLVSLSDRAVDDLPLAAFLESQPNVGPHLDSPQLALQLPVVHQPAGVERAARFGGDDRAARLLPMPAIREATATGPVIDIGERD